MINPDLLTAADAGVDQTSVKLDTGDEKGYSIAVTFSSATLNGSVKLTGSIDDVTYFDIDNSTKTVTSGAAVGYDVPNHNYRYVKAVWTRSSGSGTITVKGFVKQPNINRN